MKNQKMSGKGSSHKPSPSSSSHRKTRWESGNPPLFSPPGSESQPHGSDSKTPNTKPSSSSNPSDPILPLPLPLPDPSASGRNPNPPPPYGFHMLDRRTFVLADGSVRSYFALPPDYSQSPAGRSGDLAGDKFLPYGHSGHGPESSSLGLGFQNHRMSPDGFRRDREEQYWTSSRGPPMPESSLKRKYSEEDHLARQREQLLQYGNPNPNPNGFLSAPSDRSDFMRGNSSPWRRELPDSGRGGAGDLRHSKFMKVGGENYEDLPSRRGLDGKGVVADVDTKNYDVNPHTMKRKFLHYSKSLNENAAQRTNYLEDGKHGPMQCLACGRDSKDFTDIHGLIMHAYNSKNTDLRADHLGLHKALCVLMGWNYVKAPENSKAYQTLSADDATANREDLIIWPPIVVIHNTNSGRRKDGRMEGLGNKDMDNKLKELGFGGGKSKSMYGKEGHLGTTVVRFASNQSGLKDAEHLAEYFEKENHGRKGWAHAQALQSGKDDESNPYLVKMDEKTGEKKRIFYGYLGTASDLDKVDFDTKNKAVIKSRREFDPSD
ncbi:uncharacterized protein LOC143881420 [Tasmannia lanceolata]|uniref:uncharacterized protein LOC143881420 n=1 Tax=Tasmannia lanceolata TaxID=3420 RepID=UPI004062C5CB